MSLDKESAKWKEFSEVLASNISKDKDYFTITEMYYISSHKLQEKVTRSLTILKILFNNRDLS